MHPDQAKATEQAIIAGDIDGLAALLIGTPREGRAQEVILGEHFFRSWPEFEAHRKAEPDSACARFESAVEAAIEGDASILRELLRADPGLIQARSARTHRATLLHYVGANGVEGFRQKTPAYIVEIARILLDAGAPVDATASMYSDDRDTTLGLTVTSIYPVRAGVLEGLVDLLLGRGAKIDDGMVRACHANGRPEAARLLAERGAPLDLEAAAGLGRIDLVRALFQSAPAGRVRDGFAWACEYGHTETVAYFLERGMDVRAKLRNHGQTGLHWAACGGHVEIVRLLIAHRSPLDAKDDAFGGTALTWALWGFHNRDPRTSTPDGYYEVVRLLVAEGSEVNPEWVSRETDPMMAGALSQ